MRIRDGFPTTIFMIITALVNLLFWSPGYGFLYDVDEDIKIMPTGSSRSVPFGHAVALSGDRALFGGGSLSPSGSAMIFRFDGDIWVEEAFLLPSDGASGDQFGCSVSLDGDVAIVGTREDAYQGSAYIFRFDGEEWIEEAKLLSPDPDVNEQFGHAVSIEGDTALVGAYLDRLLGMGRGAAYIYRHDGESWLLEATLTTSDSTCYWFGKSVCLSADRALIGTDGDNENGSTAGAAYIFRRDGSGWIEEEKLLASDGDSGDSFGYAVSLSNDVALIGADYDEASADRGGSAYIFRREGSGWIEEQKLLGSDVDEQDYFGSGVAIDGDTAVVTRGPGTQSGALVFRFDGGTWVEVARLRPSRYPTASLGAPVAMEGESILIGGCSGTGMGAVFNFWNWHNTMDCDYVCSPVGGTLPFTTRMGVRLTNNYVHQKRRIAACIRVNMAGGYEWSNWKRGYTQLDPGESYVNYWGQNLPAYASLVGANIFTLTAEDVTPSPFNQPPYPPAGDDDTEVLTVVGIAP